MKSNLAKQLLIIYFTSLTLLNTKVTVAAEKVVFPDYNSFSYKQTKPKHSTHKHKNNIPTNKNSVLLRRVTIHGNKAIDSKNLKSLIVDNIGKNTTPSNIQKKLEDYYYKEGFLLPIITVTTTKDGVFNVSIIEGKINNVDLVVSPQDKEIANNELLQKYINNIISLSPTKTKDVQKYILLISEIPGYNVEYRLIPAQRSQHNTDVANLVLEIKKTKATLNLNASNYGNRELGKQILLGSIKINNPFGYNEAIMADLGTSNHPDSLKLATVGYLKRLNAYGTSASITGSLLIDNAYKHSSIPGSAKNDRSTMIKGEISQYLLLNNNNSLRLDLGTEYRNITNNIIGQKATKYHYDLGFIKAKIKHTDFLNAINWFTPSILSTLGNAKQSIFAPETYNFDSNFTLFNLVWYRDQVLFSSNFSLFSQVTWQYSKDSLPLEQQFLIGSNIVGRTYKNGLINANKGHDINLELRYTHQYDKHPIINILQPYTFFDISHFSNDKAINSNQTTLSSFNKHTLSGAGAGIRLFFSYDFSAEFEAGVPITKKIKINDIETKNKNKYSFMLNKVFNW